jgi:toxin ParE1/3/4
MSFRTSRTRRSRPSTNTRFNFGEAQPDAYFVGMHDLFDLLAATPLIGHEAAELGEGIRRFLYEAHIVSYRSISDGILVLDIVGVRQKPRSKF